MNRFGRFGRFGDAGMPGGPAAGNLPPVAPGMPGQGFAPGTGMAPLPEDQYGAYHKNAKFWFTYQTPNIASLAAAGTTTNSITFDNDSAFEWTKITYTCDLTNHAQGLTASGQATGTATAQNSIVAPYVTLQIQDTGQGAYYSNAQIPLYVYAGGQTGLPYVMPAPQIIAPNATLQFNWSNYSTAGGGNETYNNLRLQLHGWKIRR